MTGNNPKLDLVNVDAHKKIGQILSIFSQGIERKQYSDTNQGPKFCEKMMGNNPMSNNPKLDLVSVVVHTKYGQILSIHSQDIDQKQNSDINQGL